MTRFRFMLIGACERPVIEVDVDGMDGLCEYLGRTKFVEGRLVEVNGHGEDCSVIIPVSRIQMVAEAG